MKRITTLLLAACAAVLTSCASIPRDAGVSDVRQAVAQRGGPNIEWHTQSTPPDRDRLAGMLQGDLSADQAVAVAMANSPRLQAELAELGIARADLIEASTVTNPLLAAEIRFPAAPYRPYELRLAQTLIDLVQLPRRRALGRATFDAAQMRVSADVLRFAGGVRSSWYDLLAATQQLALSRTTLESAQAAAEVALKQHEAGNITDLDLENEQASYEQARLDLARAEQRALVARESLARRMGLGDSPLEWRIAGAFPELPASEMDQQQLERTAADQRLDIAIARRELEAAGRQIPIARMAVLSQAVIDYHYQREAGGEGSGGPGIDIPIPLFDSGRAARTRAEAQYLRARRRLDALTAESASQLRSARASLAEARARVEYYRDVVVPRRERILELTKLEHNAMLAGVFQLLQAKQNEVQARRDSIEARRQYWAARTDLDRVLQGIADTSFEPAPDQGQGGRTNITRGGH